MLPDFPTIKKHLLKALARLTQDLTKKHPILSQIRSRPVFEGNRTTITEEASRRETPFVRIKMPTSIPREQIIARGHTLIPELSVLFATQLVQRQLELLTTRIKEVAESVGNVTDAGGQPLTPELYLDNFEKVWTEFDDDGKPHVPSLFHPDPAIHERFQVKLSQWLQDPEFVRRLSEVIEKKRKLWNDRESNRKLVD